MNDIETKLLKLNELAIFKMSLGSKELFHSNFLEFIWDVNREFFIRIVNLLIKNCGHTEEIVLQDNMHLGREKLNFDLCLYTGEEDKPDNYIMIIENKVKSIPSKSQWDNYTKKIKQKNKPYFILLTLLNEFPDKKEIKEGHIWDICSYKELKEAIKNNLEDVKDANTKMYIEDYCVFIGLMHELSSLIVPDTFKKQSLFPSEEIELFKKSRLHDLYIKLRGLSFLQELKHLIGEDKVMVSSFAGDKLRQKILKHEEGFVPDKVYLNFAIYRSEGQVAAFVFNNKSPMGDIYEIVIQGVQYRHGINHYVEDSYNKIEAQNKIWDEIHPNGKEFLCNNWKFGDNNIFPDKSSKGRNGAFLGYSNDYIYKYIKIANMSVKVLLDGMSKEILNLYREFYIVP